MKPQNGSPETTANSHQAKQPTAKPETSAHPNQAAESQPVRYAVNGELLITQPKTAKENKSPSQEQTQNSHSVDLSAALNAPDPDIEASIKIQLKGSQTLKMLLQEMQGVQVKETDDGVVLKGALASIQQVLSDVDILTVGGNKIQPALVTMDVDTQDGSYAKQVRLIFNEQNNSFNRHFKLGSDTPFEPYGITDYDDSQAFTFLSHSFSQTLLGGTFLQGTTRGFVDGTQSGNNPPTNNTNNTSNNVQNNSLLDVEGIRSLFNNLRDKVNQIPNGDDSDTPSSAPATPTTPTTTTSGSGAAANTNPTAVNISDTSAQTTNAFSYNITSFFSDSDGDTLTYNATLLGGGALPAWLSLDAATGIFSGTPLVGDAGDITVTVTANDGRGGSVSGNFEMNIDAYDYYFNDGLSQNITTTAASERIFMGGGDDTVISGDGNDTVYGGTGNDTIYGGNSGDLLDGQDGDDEIYGENGGDTLYGGAGNDTIDGGSNEDLIYGDDGNDSIDGGGNNDTIYGGAGNDTIDGGLNDDLIYGGDGDDLLFGGARQDTIYGGDGDDRISGDANADTVYGGTGADVFVYADKEHIMDFEVGVDKIELNFAASGIGTDDDQMRLTYDAVADETKIQHGAYNFSVTLAGNVALTDDDLILYDSLGVLMGTYTGDDTINGTAGDDYLNGQNGSDEIHGAGGNDSILGGNSSDLLYGDDGDDRLGGMGGDDTIYGGNGADRLNGDDGDDELYGDDGDDELYGDDGDDTILGGAGDDTLYGNRDNDRLDGGAGADTLWGGNGADVFVYSDGDTIEDFELGTDKIEVNFASSGIGGSSDQLRVNYDAVADITTLRLDDLGFSINLTGDKSAITDADLILYDSLGVLQNSYDAGDDTIYGTAGVDYLNGGSGDDEIHGDAGDDFIYGRDGSDLIYGDAGNDEINGQSQDDTIYGGSGEDTLRGAAGDDSIYGGDDDDNLYGDSGDDQVFGGGGDDFFGGGNGADTLWGGDGYDYMAGGNQDDVIYGEGDRDTMRGGKGSDTLWGGADKDTYLYYDFDESSIADGIDLIADFTQADNDIITLRNLIFDGTIGSEAGQLEMSYDAVNDWTVLSDPYAFGSGLVIHLAGNIALTDADFYLVGNTNGTTGNDTLTGNGIYGNDGDDMLYLVSGVGTRANGGAGNDLLQVNSGGNSFLFGGADNDTLHGGVGEDSLIGGDGDDVFRFNHTASSAADHIADMNQRGTDDTIALSDAAYVFGSQEGTKAGQTLVHGTDITSVAGFGGGNFGVAAGITFLFDTTTRELWYDADGSGGGGNAVLIATIDNADYVYDASDFVGY